MNFSSVSGKNWLFKKFDSSEVNKFVENYSLSEITAKLLSIRKNNIENIDLFLTEKPYVMKGKKKKRESRMPCHRSFP